MTTFVRTWCAEALRKRPSLTEKERLICSTIGPELSRRGLLFVGIDVIDGYLTEINVTSPTGIRAIKKLGGPDLAVAIWDAIEAKIAERLTFLSEPGSALRLPDRGRIYLQCQTPKLPRWNAAPAPRRA